MKQPYEPSRENNRQSSWKRYALVALGAAAFGVGIGHISGQMIHHPDGSYVRRFDRHHPTPTAIAAPAPVAEKPLQYNALKTPGPNAPVFAGVDLTDRIEKTDSVVLVLDISSSMRGHQIEKAKTEAAKFVEKIPEKKKINLVAYNSDVISWNNSVQDATKENKQSIYEWIAGLGAAGKTSTVHAMYSVLTMEPKTKYVVLLTDGAPTDCNSSLADMSNYLKVRPTEEARDAADCVNQILRANNQKARIDTFGIGAIGPFEEFLKQLASKTKGTYVRVGLDALISVSAYQPPEQITQPTSIEPPALIEPSAPTGELRPSEKPPVQLPESPQETEPTQEPDLEPQLQETPH